MNVKMILDFCKTHLIALVCGVLSIAFVAGAVMGMSSTAVVDQMKKELNATGASSIAGLRSSPKNADIINAEKKRGEAFEAEYSKTIDAAKKINKRDVLMPGVFPKPASDAAPYQFRDAYLAEMTKLAIPLDAVTPPTQAEIDEVRQNIEDEYKAKSEQNADATAAAATGQAPPTVSTPQNTVGTVGMAGGGRGARGGTGASYGGASSSGVQLPDEPKYNAVLRARVNKARSSRMYYDPERTFHAVLSRLESTAPTPEDMWYAQVSLWIQQDVVKGIADINDDAASKASGDASVALMPVKRLVGIRVLGYELQGKSRLQFPSVIDLPAIGEQTAQPSFTGLVTTPDPSNPFDVLRFEVGIVVDQRDLMRVVDSICRRNYFKVIGINYDQVNRDRDETAEGYLYGPDPVVFARLSFEGYMARDVFDELKPESVRVKLGQSTAAPPANP